MVGPRRFRPNRRPEGYWIRKGIRVSPYDAFVSYSHAKDKPIASALQAAVQKLGKPWYRRRALRVFRDDTSLSATPGLWPSIERALEQSRYLILLASREAAASPWVNKEVAYWLEHKGAGTLLIALTDGTLAWDQAADEFAWHDGMPLPPALQGCFAVEPKWVDLTAYRDGADKGDARFTELAADFAAAIHGMPKEDLLSQEVRQQRRALTLAWSAAGALSILVGLAGWLWQDALAQRNRAEKTLAAATETTTGLVNSLAVRFRNVTGVPSSLVKDMLDRARDLQDQLIGYGETSPQLRRSQALALNESAITLSTLGDADAALTAARRAQSILQDLLKIEPRNAEWQRALAASDVRIGGALDQLGKLDEALAAYMDARAILQSLVAKDVNNIQWQQQLASTFTSIGDVLARQGKSKDGLAAYRDALAIRKELLAKAPTDPGRRRDLAESYGSIGNNLRSQGLLEDALIAHRDRLAILQALVAEDPSNLGDQEELWRTHTNIGNVLKAQGKFAEAVAAYREGRMLMHALVATDNDNTDLQRSLLDSDENIGDVLVLLGRYDEALVAYRDGQVVAKALAAKEPKNARWQRDLAVSMAHIGDVLERQRKFDDALSEFQAAKAIFQALTTKDPTNVGWQQSVGFVAYRIGGALLAQRKFDAALAAYREYLDIAKALVAKEPDNPQWQRDLGASNLMIGHALKVQGDLDGALQAFRHGHGVFQVLVTRFPRNNWWRRDLGVSEQDIGDILVMMDRGEEAVAAYRESFATRKGLAGQEPKNSLWQQDLRRIVRLLVKTLLNLGRAQEALAVYDEPIEYGADDVSVRWDRGQAELYAGREAAADDFAAAVKLRPADAYAVLWLHIARGRAGQDDKEEFAANAAKLEKAKWPWPIVAFYLGAGTSDAIMAAVDSTDNERARRDQTCEALFYLGVAKMKADTLPEARAHLESAAQKCPFHFTEHIGAVLELKRLRSSAGK